MTTANIPTNCKAASSYVSVDLREPVRLRIPKGDKRPPITLPQLFEETVQKLADRPALVSHDGVTFSYQEYWDKSRQLAKALISLGLEPRTSCGILAVGCPEWFITQMAVIMAGGVSAGIYMTNSPEACHHVLLNSNATVCVVDDSSQMAKIRLVKHRLPSLKAVVQMHGPFEDFVDSEVGYHSWQKVEAMGAKNSHLEQELEKRLKEVAANECAFLLYTSGTVGMPKGVMLTHDSIIVNTECMLNGLKSKAFGHEVIVSYLPMNHAAGQILEFLPSLLLGACIYFADRDALKGTLFTTTAAVRPTRFFGVPRIYEKLSEKLKSTNQSLASCGFDRCKSFLIGSAMSGSELKEGFLDYDIRLVEIYGMSEAGISIAVNYDPEEYSSCGKPISLLEVKVDQQDHTGQGEICVRGRSVFMGYLGAPEQTAETLKDDGWLHSGDVGYFDSKGRVHISGRLKELIVTSGGEKIPPVRVENLVKDELPGISNAMLIGDKRKFLSMLLSIKTVMDPDTGTPTNALQLDALEWMRSLELPYTKLSEVLAAGPCPKLLQSIQEGIDWANEKAISNAQRVQKFAILPHDFSAKTGELGPTLKLRRNIVLEKYAELIESFYRGT